MDLIDKFLKKYQNNLNSIDNDNEINLELVQRMVALQHQKLTVLKKAKTYFTCYNISKEKRKRNFGANLSITTNNTKMLSDKKLQTSSYNNLSSNKKLSNNNYLTKNVIPKELQSINHDGYNISTDIVDSINIHNSHDNKYPNINLPLDNISNGGGGGGNNNNSSSNSSSSSSSSSSSNNNRCNSRQTQRTKTIHPRFNQQIQQPIGIVTNTLLKQYSKYFNFEYLTKLKEMYTSVKNENLPYIQPYLSNRIVLALSSDIVCNYYVEVDAVRSFETPIQKKLIHHTIIPKCRICGADTSSMWHRIDSNIDSGYKCHRCITHYNSKSVLKVPKSITITTNNTKTYESTTENMSQTLSNKNETPNSEISQNYRVTNLDKLSCDKTEKFNKPKTFDLKDLQDSHITTSKLSYAKIKLKESLPNNSQNIVASDTDHNPPVLTLQSITHSNAVNGRNNVYTDCNNKQLNALKYDQIKTHLHNSPSLAAVSLIKSDIISPK